ncbi:MAG TPA: putative collagen-binding domain-containing protein, partial [Phycisphaerae bacterium]|nr:putative collagen-binding domain-containing protein [Phycisphaerae bacterium]
PADGSKVIVTDTDHLWGIGGDYRWVWKSFLRGLNPIFMDPYDGVVLDLRQPQNWPALRRAMGDVLRLARRMNLAAMTPQGKLASTGYCLAQASKESAECLVYLPDGGKATVDLSATPGPLVAEWFDPKTGKTVKDDSAVGGARREFKAPFAGDAVLRFTPSFRSNP